MKFLAVALAFGAAVSAGVCPSGGLYTNPQCCATDVLGAAGLDCKTPSSQPKGTSEFRKTCAEDGGRAAKCCVIPVAGQDLLCNDP